MTKRHWIGSYGSIPAEIDPDRFPSVTALLDDAMRRFAGHPAFRASDRTLTYADVDRLSAALAAYLQQVAQVRKGDRVAVMLPNVLAFPVVFVALARIGAVQVNVNPLYTPHELEHQLNDAGVEVAVVCGGSMATFADVVGKTRVRTVLTVGRDDLGVVDAPAGACAALPPGSLALADAFAAGAALQRAPVALDGSDLLLL